ncbi:MAG: DUF2865 domain-containing protein [Hyphomonadaceae bacterium]|nr:DUF2865 domain-containing protein [Hyphomonadaceae bacterium]
MFFSTRERGRLSFGVSVAAYGVGVLLAGTVTALGSYRVINTILSELPPGSKAGAAAAALPAQPLRVRQAAKPLPQPAERQAFMTPLQARLASQLSDTSPSRLVAPVVLGGASRYGGRASRRAREDDEDDDDHDEEEHTREEGSTYRTMCVRLCDGYYFPISFAASQDRFARDAHTCESRCGGGQASLFVYRNPGADVEDMVDLRGRPYRQLSTAFLYRQEYVPACRCQPNPWDAEARERHRMYALTAAKRKGDKEAARELDALMAKMKRNRGGPAQAAMPTEESKARAGADRGAGPSRRRSQPEDDRGRMALGARTHREVKGQPSRTQGRDPGWVRRAFGRTE